MTFCHVKIIVIKFPMLKIDFKKSNKMTRINDAYTCHPVFVPIQGALKRNICHRPFIKPYQGWENNEPNASQWEIFKVHHLFLNTVFLLFLDY